MKQRVQRMEERLEEGKRKAEDSNEAALASTLNHFC